MTDGGTVAVAYAGDLESSALVARAAAAGSRVVAVYVDTGARPDAATKALDRRARALGAAELQAVDARDLVFARYAARLVEANLLRRGATSLWALAERYAVADAVAEAARAHGAAAIHHGSRGRGDRARVLARALRALAPDRPPAAPLAGPAGPAPEDLRAELEERGLGEFVGPVEDRAELRASGDLWGTTARGGELADPWAPPPDEAFPSVAAPWDAEPLPEEFDVEFARGLPVVAFGSPGPGVGLVAQLARFGRRHGLGRRLLTGRDAGRATRIAVEAPAAVVLVAAHRELEELLLSERQLLTKGQLARTYADLFARGRYHDPIGRDLEAFFASTQRGVDGTVRLRAYRGNLEVIGVEAREKASADDG